MSNVSELPGASLQAEPTRANGAAITPNPTANSQEPKVLSRRNAAPNEQASSPASAEQTNTRTSSRSRSRSRRNHANAQSSAGGAENAGNREQATAVAPQSENGAALAGSHSQRSNANNAQAKMDQPKAESTANTAQASATAQQSSNAGATAAQLTNPTNPNSSRSRSRRSHSSGQPRAENAAKSTPSEQNAAKNEGKTPVTSNASSPINREQQAASSTQQRGDARMQSTSNSYRNTGNNSQANTGSGQRYGGAYPNQSRLTSDQRLGNANGRYQSRQGNGSGQYRQQQNGTMQNGAMQNRPSQHSPAPHRQQQDGSSSYRDRSPQHRTPGQNRPAYNNTSTYYTPQDSTVTSFPPTQQTTSIPSGRSSGGGRTGHAHGGGRSGGRGSKPGGTRTPTRKTHVQTHDRRMTAPVKERPTGPISLPPQIGVKDLADLLGISATETIRTLIKHKIFANINEVVDYEKAALAAQDIGYEPTPLVAAIVAEKDRVLSASDVMVASRKHGQTVEVPPVVTIMGHVDHGKTSLLDMIRKTKVAVNEAGGITQHIGAYQVEVNNKKITFLDTPGHEAFTAMRARGAHVTHIAIIVVAADDGIMPQTVEAIDHAKAANVPILIALNKIDKPNANPDRVKQQLAEIGLLVEEYGGETVCVPVSAKKGIGLDELLDYILLVAEMQDIQANPNGPANGVIIEAKLEKSTGATASVLVQQGTLKMGDSIVVGAISGKVRAMFNDRGKRIQKAPPSTPVSILGLPEVPQAGDRLQVVSDDKTAKQQAQQVAAKRREEAAPLGQVSLDTLYMQMQEGKVKELNVILKSDVQGSSEAIKNSLSKLGEENRKVRLIHEGVGNISETDVHLAGASGAIIIGFNVKADGAAQREAQKEGVDIRYYEVIYKLIDDIQAALVGMLEPTYREVIDGHAEVVQTFKAGKNLVIAGCRITDGKIVRSSQARILRKKEKVFEGKIGSLRRGKDDVREVTTGYECGIVIEEFNGFEAGDIIEAFSQERVMPGKA